MMDLFAFIIIVFLIVFLLSIMLLAVREIVKREMDLRRSEACLWRLMKKDEDELKRFDADCKRKAEERKRQDD